MIRNGRLGLSSHHGIHGNLPRNVLVEDVTFFDYEVAAVALNGPYNVALRNLTLLGQRTDIPVTGQYSLARFLLPILNYVVARNPTFPVVAPPIPTLAVLTAQLKAIMAHAFNDIIVADRMTVDGDAHPVAYEQFGNPSGLIDGNAYGILINRAGVAINGFGADASQLGQRDIWRASVLIDNVRINNVVGAIAEVVALATDDGKAIARGPVGDLVQMSANTRGKATQLFVDDDGRMATNALVARAQTYLMMLAIAQPALRPLLGTITVGPLANALVDWLRAVPTANLATVVQTRQLRYLRNGDTMFHANKGIIAVRIDSVRDVCIRRTEIVRVQNLGEAGNAAPLPGETDGSGWYSDGSDGGHPTQGLQQGYQGADARGISISGAADVYLQDVSVTGVTSNNGFARGIDVFNYAVNVHLRNTTIVGVFASATWGRDGVNIVSRTATKIAQAIGLHISSDAKNVRHTPHEHAKSIQSEDLVGQALVSASEAPNQRAGEILAAMANATTNTYGHRPLLKQPAARVLTTTMKKAQVQSKHACSSVFQRPYRLPVRAKIPWPIAVQCLLWFGAVLLLAPVPAMPANRGL